MNRNQSEPTIVSNLKILQLAFIWLLLALPVAASEPEGLDDDAIAALAQRAMTEFQVPGMAIAIVKGGQTIYARGHGVLELGKPEQVNPDTMFKIASNSKAFTTAALATLVDQGSVAWNGLVIDYLPEFRLYDPWVTREFTVVDMLSHRSGIAIYSGDLMLWPEPNHYTKADIIHALRYFKPVNSFRTEYDYDNLMYVVAGEVLARVTGQPWGEYVDQKIMQKLDMKRCFAGTIPNDQMRNLAAPHGVSEGRLAVIERSRILVNPPINAAAGGVVCSLTGMLPWVKTQLNRGTSPEGIELFSQAQSKQLWHPRTNMRVSERDYKLNRTHFYAYGLGWRLRDVHGYKQVSHTGYVAGMASAVALIPELELGVIVLSNGSSDAARSAVRDTLLRSFLPVEPLDWIALAVADIRVAEQAKSERTGEFLSSSKATGTGDEPEISGYVGLYRDPWFGDVQITAQDGKLQFAALKSPKLSAPLSYRSENIFIARWLDRTIEGDAIVEFRVNNKNEVTSMYMRDAPWHPGRGYDFVDLKFLRVASP